MAHNGAGFPECKIGGVLVFKSLGDQDVDVDITGDGDTDATPAGLSGDATGVGTPPTLVAENTIEPRGGRDIVVYRRRKQQPASIARGTMPHVIAREGGSSVHNVSSEHIDFQVQKNSGLHVPMLAAMQQERQVSTMQPEVMEVVQELANHPNNLEIESKEKGQRNMVWVKGQVDGKQVWWPGLIVKQVLAPVLEKIIDNSTELTIRLFHPPKDLELYQVVKRSSLRPFFLRACRDNNSHPDFEVAVTEADRYLTVPYPEEFPEMDTKSETRLDGDGDTATCVQNYVSSEHAGSNSLKLNRWMRQG